jgi:hypothetical protein
MAELTALRFQHAAGFFKHELQPVGPDSGFRAVSATTRDADQAGDLTDANVDYFTWIRYMYKDIQFR